MHRDRHRDGQRFVVKPVIIDIVGETVCPVGPCGDLSACHAFGVVQKFGEIRRCHLRPVAVEHLAKLARAGSAGGELRLQITDDPVRQAHVYVDHLKQRIVRHACFEQFERGNPQPFLKYFGGIAGIRPCHPAADIGVMADDHGKALKVLIGIKDRHEHENIRQMHPALIGIVQDHGIPGYKPVAILFEHDAHRLGHGTQMKCHRLCLGDHIAVRVADRGGVIHHVLDDLGTRRADDVIGHLVDDRVEAVFDHREGDRINLYCHIIAPSRCRGPKSPDCRSRRMWRPRRAAERPWCHRLPEWRDRSLRRC